MLAIFHKLISPNSFDKSCSGKNKVKFFGNKLKSRYCILMIRAEMRIEFHSLMKSKERNQDRSVTGKTMGCIPRPATSLF